jgi:hypothetical protein
VCNSGLGHRKPFSLNCWGSLAAGVDLAQIPQVSSSCRGQGCRRPEFTSARRCRVCCFFSTSPATGTGSAAVTWQAFVVPLWRPDGAWVAFR